MKDDLSSADRAYEALREMAIGFDFKPGERLNESALSKTLAVSRTPLREALNRLVAEGFLTVSPGRGFFCRALSPGQVLELYQIRSGLETEAVLRGIAQADDSGIAALCAHLDATEETYANCTDLPELLRMDEEFHMRLAGLSGNGELCRMLRNVYERIRYVRLINLRQLRSQPGSGEDRTAHRRIAEAVRARDSAGAVEALRRHIERRSEETRDLVRLAYSELYVPD
ncbi:GntR family transcriptional regulator [Salipiger sp. P9]|uniref:GntR family transcriptional regulator n=1 Tax=Salipiger pentaromativorans TaxID=2943193 RepID=UPI002157E3A0|nr:GntR family transcriptional regulator [Salipiger pentaromativorans]MCR8547874.1 GntR family transcriptional regulator [Salipiger pentaromativorans]